MIVWRSCAYSHIVLGTPGPACFKCVPAPAQDLKQSALHQSWQQASICQGQVWWTAETCGAGGSPEPELRGTGITRHQFKDLYQWLLNSCGLDSCAERPSSGKCHVWNHFILPASSKHSSCELNTQVLRNKHCLAYTYWVWFEHFCPIKNTLWDGADISTNVHQEHWWVFTEGWVRKVTPSLSNHMVTHGWNHLLKQREAGNSGSSYMIRFSMLWVSVWLLYMKISVFLKRKPFILYRYAELSYSTSRPNTDCPMHIHIQYRALGKSLVVQQLKDFTQGKGLQRQY